MSYEFRDLLYPTAGVALRAVAGAWLWAGMSRPYPETLERSPDDLARECIEAWGLDETLREWGVDHDALVDAMRAALDAARSEHA